jgi:large subunit ribosomal protein L21
MVNSSLAAAPLQGRELKRMYAVIRTGGKQYTIREGQQLDVETLPGAAGDRVELRDILLVGDGDQVAVGTPTVLGAHVLAEILQQGRSKKVTIFKYKAKTRYRRKAGHRQPFTRLAIRQIVPGGSV